MRRFLVQDRTDDWFGICADAWYCSAHGLEFRGLYDERNHSPPLIALFAPDEWCFCRELSDGEEWPIGIDLYLAREGQKQVTDADDKATTD